MIPTQSMTVVSVDAIDTPEAARQMRELGYRKTTDLRWRAHGLTVEDLLAFGLSPAVCRFKRSGRVMNGLYWTAKQEAEVARCSICLLARQIEALSSSVSIFADFADEGRP